MAVHTAELAAEALADRHVPKVIATVCLSGTLEEKLDAAAAAGFDGIEVFEQDLLAAALRPAEIRDRCRDLGLRVDLYQPVRDTEAVGPAEFSRVLRRFEHKLEVAQRLGAPMLLACSNVSPGAIDDDDLAAEQLGRLADRAAQRGLRVAYEALAWGTHVDDYRHAWKIVEIAGHDALGVCLDSFHILSRGHDPAGIRAIPAEKIFFVQLSDAPRVGMDVLAWSRHHRCFPGQGDFDLRSFIGHLAAAGYAGPLSLEVFNDVFRQAAPARIAVDAMRSLVSLEEGAGGSSGRGEPAITGASARRRGPARLAEVRTHGFAFAELAVGAASRPLMGHVLAGMGFARTGHHLTKPVELWEQGAARILLNSGPVLSSWGAAPEVMVGAIAVETDDPPSAARRAQQLGAPLLARTRGPEEADLAAVCAPDGTSVFFCRSDTGPAKGWRGDFRAAAGRGGERAQHGAGLVAIDHIGLSQPFDYFDEAMLFYRCVLDLKPREISELASPGGLIRSRAMANADGSTRIAINSSLLGPGAHGGFDQGWQHVAFLTGDVFATVRAMRANGVPFLRIPENYYDDLEARADLDPRVLGEMRTLGVLYDRAGGGEFFHAFTPLLSAGFFLEVIQRTGGYDGYGAVNAPIRMAAQRRY